LRAPALTALRLLLIELIPPALRHQLREHIEALGSSPATECAPLA
jgi:hypothetical protein